MDAKQLNTVRLVKMLASDLDPTKPNFKLTLDSLLANLNDLRASLNIDKATRDSEVK